MREEGKGRSERTLESEGGGRCVNERCIIVEEGVEVLEDLNQDVEGEDGKHVGWGIKKRRIAAFSEAKWDLRDRAGYQRGLQQYSSTVPDSLSTVGEERFESRDENCETARKQRSRDDVFRSGV